MLQVSNVSLSDFSFAGNFFAEDTSKELHSETIQVCFVLRFHTAYSVMWSYYPFSSNFLVIWPLTSDVKAAAFSATVHLSQWVEATEKIIFSECNREIKVESFYALYSEATNYLGDTAT